MLILTNVSVPGVKIRVQLGLSNPIRETSMRQPGSVWIPYRRRKAHAQRTPVSYWPTSPPPETTESDTSTSSVASSASESSGTPLATMVRTQDVATQTEPWYAHEDGRLLHEERLSRINLLVAALGAAVGNPTPEDPEANLCSGVVVKFVQRRTGSFLHNFLK